ncbi:MFS transporter [Leifsonia sp. 2MCAF36]|uniref:MFS transporter n=1 Tax=Leifsonia sp. 2MCAF36 TaxID=3232988 RepID=UPI003F97C613
MKHSRSAIWIFLALSGVGVGCFSVVDNLYFHGKGYSTAVIGGLVAVFNISVAVAEIPAAIVFDRRSHWMAIQVGNLVRTAALILFFLSLGVAGDILAEALAGVGAAAMSGTSTAYVLNRLRSGGQAEQRRAMARIVWLGSASSLMGGLLGALLFTVAPRTIWLGGALCMAAAGAVFLIGRPRSEQRHDVATEPLRTYVRGLGALATHPRAWMSIFANAALVGPLILWQLRLGAGSLGAVILGFAVMKAAGVLGGRLIAGRRIPRATLFILAGVNAAAMCAFAASDTWAVIIAGFGVHVVSHVAISVYCSAQFQHVVPDNRRAGASSVVSLLGSGLTAMAAIAVGTLADRYSALAAITPSLLLYGLVVGIALASGIRSRHGATPPTSVRNEARDELLLD